MTEVWKSISGFSNYEVSTNGRIRSIKRVKKFKNGRLVQFESKIKLIRKHPKNGFLMTDLISNDGKRKTVYPHKVVALAFIENEDPAKNKVVIHKDDDLSNLINKFQSKFPKIAIYPISSITRDGLDILTDELFKQT